VAVVVPQMVYPVTLFVQCLGIAFERAGRPQLIVSSWLRSLEAQDDLVEQGRGVGNSLHLKGLAMDLQGKFVYPGRFTDLGPMEQAWRSLGLDAVRGGGTRVEPTFPPSVRFSREYLHIELDGPRLRELGVDFRR